MDILQVFIGISLVIIDTCALNDVSPLGRALHIAARDGNVFQAKPLSGRVMPFQIIQECYMACLETPACQYIQVSNVSKTCSLLTAGARASTFNDSIIYQVQQRSAQVTVLQ